MTSFALIVEGLGANVGVSGLVVFVVAGTIGCVIDGVGSAGDGAPHASIVTVRINIKEDVRSLDIRLPQLFAERQSRC
ncbi:hypothetical protein ACFLUZ_05920 [Chloroflexota bacterium]